jgi:hypothetical protein
MSPKSKIQWEYDLVERPFCEQLRAIGWEWIEGDVENTNGEISLRNRVTSPFDGPHQ